MNKKQGILALLLSFSSRVLAVDTIGVTNNAMQVMTFFIQLIYAACYVIGACFLAGGLMQYRNYRRNSQQVRLSTPICMGLFGLALILMPWLTSLSYSSFD